MYATYVCISKWLTSSALLFRAARPLIVGHRLVEICRGRMRVGLADHRQVRVAEDSLKRHRVLLHPHPVGGEGMSEQVWVGALLDASALGRNVHHVLSAALL